MITLGRQDLTVPLNPEEPQTGVVKFVSQCVTEHFSVKVELTQFRKYRSLCNRQVKHIGAETCCSFE